MGNLLFGVLAILATATGIVEWWLVCGVFLGMAVAVAIGDIFWRRKMAVIVRKVDLMNDKVEKAKGVGDMYFQLLEVHRVVAGERDLLKEEVWRIQEEFKGIKKQNEQLHEICEKSISDTRYLSEVVKIYLDGRT